MRGASTAQVNSPALDVMAFLPHVCPCEPDRLVCRTASYTCFLRTLTPHTGTCIIQADGTKYTGAWVCDQMQGAGCVSEPRTPSHRSLRDCRRPMSL
jgi:hypothetical protein